MTSPTNKITGFYINLDSREDRKTHFEELKRNHPFFENVERMSAVCESNGAIGCGKSHIQVLSKCLELDGEVFLVCEDDLTILNEEHFKKFVDSIDIHEDWDLITLTPRGTTMKGEELSNGFSRIYNNQTTTGYIIKKSIIPNLIENLNKAINGLEKGGAPVTYSIDQYWKRLQTKHRFYYFNHIFAGQLPGYSDIEETNVNYNKRFIEQNNY
jgi:GR25 family glycosyltransferase involved in LPS biosynthesis